MKDRLAVVAGGTAGIGRATTLALALEGCRVVAVSRGGADAEALRVVASGRIHTLAADLSTPDGIERLGAGMASFGVPDILVNSIGNAQGGLFWTLPDEVWAQSFDLKVMGVIRLLRLFVPQMVELGRGRIVNVVGNNGRQPGARFLPGSAANAALLAVTKGLADEVAQSGVTINAINPGPTRTRRWTGMMTAAAASSGRAATDIEAEHIAGIPVGRLSEPEEIARYILFLCSPLSTAATGTSITIDGGATRAIA